MSGQSSRPPDLTAVGVRLRAYSRIDQLGTKKELHTGRYMYADVRKELFRIFASTKG